MASLAETIDLSFAFGKHAGEAKNRNDHTLLDQLYQQWAQFIGTVPNAYKATALMARDVAYARERQRLEVIPRWGEI